MFKGFSSKNSKKQTVMAIYPLLKYFILFKQNTEF